MAGAASGAVSTLTQGIWDMADGTTSFNIEEVGKLAMRTLGNAAIGYGIGKYTGKLGEKMVNKNLTLKGWKFKYDYANKRIKSGAWTIWESLQINGTKFFTVEGVSALPSLGAGSVKAAIDNWIEDFVETNKIEDMAESMKATLQKLSDMMSELEVLDVECSMSQ